MERGAIRRDLDLVPGRAAAWNESRMYSVYLTWTRSSKSSRSKVATYPLKNPSPLSRSDDEAEAEEAGGRVPLEGCHPLQDQVGRGSPREAGAGMSEEDGKAFLDRKEGHPEFSLNLRKLGERRGWEVGVGDFFGL